MEARAFREYLHKDVNGGQYSLKYNHPDTLKLRMLTEFGRDIVVGGKVTVEDETARMDGQPVMGVGKIPAYANHRNLKRLRRQKAKLDAEFAELSLRYHAGDADAGKERLLVSQERNELSDKIHAIEGAVLDAFSLVAEMARERQTERAEEAARLLEAGEYEQAQAVLQSVDSPEIKADWERAEQMASAGLEAVRALIQENRLRIQTLLAQGVDKETLPELEACYKQNADAAQKYHMEPDAVYDYAEFLEFQTDYPQAIALCEWLEVEYRQTDAPPETWAKLWNLLGICHYSNKNFSKSEICYRNALKCYHAIFETTPAAFSSDFAIVRNNLAALLNDTGKYKEAEALYRETLKICRASAETNPAFVQCAADTCNHLAALLNDLGEYKEGEKLYREALKIRCVLAEAYPAMFTVDVAQSYNNLAKLLENTRKYEEAGVLYQKALKIRRALAEANPYAFTPNIANTCNNLASLLQQRKYEKAEALCREALKCYRALATTNPSAFVADVAQTCHNLASLLMQLNRYEEAEAFFREALETRRDLAKAYPGAFLPYVADTYFNLGLFEFAYKCDPIVAKEYLHEALSIFEKFPHLAQKAARTREILSLLNWRMGLR